jgi:hypothetical protein
MRTADLIGPALDWAVAKIEGELKKADFYTHESNGAFMLEVGEVSWVYSPTTKWAQGGPIIEREWIEVVTTNAADNEAWEGICPHRQDEAQDAFIARGSTPLVAAMRCYVASKLGDDVAIPEELK